MLSKRLVAYSVAFALVSAAWAGAQSASQRSKAGTDNRPAMVTEPAAPDAATPAPATAQAVVPPLIKFSGTLRDLAGKPISGPADVTFSLYSEETGGSPLWYETQTVVADAFGRYTVLLGAMTPQGVPMELFASGQAHWLGTLVGNLPEQPRVLLVSVPYALKAGDAQTLGGKPASAYQLTGSGSTSNTTLAGLVQASALTSTSGGIAPKALTTTQNRLPVFADNTGALTDSIVVQSGASVGINTPTPAAGLDVNTNIFMVGPKASLPGGGGTMRFRDDSGTVRWLFGIPGVVGSQDFQMYNYTNGHAPIYIQNGAPSYSFYFSSSGNVGIGTNAPAYRLDVNGTGRISGALTLTTGVSGNLKINGAGNALVFPDGTVMTSAGAGTNGGTITGVTAGTGLSGGGTAGGVTLSLASASCAAGSAVTALPLSCQPFATLGANSFTGNQTVTGNVSASGTVTGSQLSSTIANGTAPLSVVSSTVVPNLNASFLNGQSASSFAGLGANSFVGDQTVTGNIAASGSVTAGTASVTGALSSGQASFAANNGSSVVSISQSGAGTALSTTAPTASIGIFASANTTNGVGIEGSIGVAIALPSHPAGVLGVTNASNGYGVEGIASSATSIAGVFNNTVAAGQILSGQAGGSEVFAVSYGGGVTAKSIRPALNTVTFAATAVFDASLGNTQKMTLTGNVTSFTIPNAAAGQTIRFIWVQDATGSRTVSGGPSMKGFTSPGTTANSYSIQSCTYDGSTWVCEPAATNL